MRILFQTKIRVGWGGCIQHEIVLLDFDFMFTSKIPVFFQQALAPKEMLIVSNSEMRCLVNGE